MAQKSGDAQKQSRYLSDVVLVGHFRALAEDSILQNEPVEERRRVPRTKVMPRMPESVLFSQTLEATASEVTEAVKAQSLEGVIAKRRDSLYEPGRRFYSVHLRARGKNAGAKPRAVPAVLGGPRGCICKRFQIHRLPSLR